MTLTAARKLTRDALIMSAELAIIDAKVELAEAREALAFAVKAENVSWHAMTKIRAAVIAAERNVTKLEKALKAI